MQTRKLGNSDMSITPVGFGAWAIGGAWKFGWGPQDDTESIGAIHRALDAGINWIDTAAIYGLGRSEEVVARALAETSHKPYVFTKCSMIWNEKREVGNSLKADSIRKECEASLQRLKCDTIDLYQIHWPNPDPDIEEGWQTLADLKKEGKLRYIGVSNFNVAQMKRAQAIAPITSLQPRYSMLHREIEKEILPYAEAQNIGVIAYSPMGSGLLTGGVTAERMKELPADDWRHKSADFQEPALSRNLKLVELLKQIAQRDGRQTAEVSIAWVLRKPAVTAAIVGARRPGQVDGIKGGLDYRLSAQAIDEIETFLKNNPV